VYQGYIIQRVAIREALNDFFLKKKTEGNLLALKEITTIKYETAPSVPAIHTL